MLFRSGLLAGLGASGLVGIPLALLLLVRRERAQSAVIRNLSEAMEQANSALLVLDPAGRVEYCNDIGARQLGVGLRSLIGRGWREFFGAANGSPAVTEIAGALAAGVPWQGEWDCRRADGTAFPVRGGFSPVRRRNQRLAAFVVVFDDVTDVRRREQELREATARAEAGDRAKGHFLATMSHEVRTPLNGIVGFTGLLLETPLSALQREYLLTIRSSADALVCLTGDILDLARIESGKARIETAPCDPRECVEEALELHAAAAAEVRLEIFHRIAPDVPASILTDHGRLRQILVNLIGNAVKFTESGEIVLTIRRHDAPPISSAEADGRATLHFSVRDTGIGIPLDRQAAIFDAFTQVDGSSTRKYGGTGLGLTIANELVALMGGRLWVDSAPGAGSTFHFLARFGVSPVTAAAPWGDRRISALVVERHGPSAEALAALLRSWGATVRLAPGGHAAMAAADQAPAVDVAFVDADLEGLSAVEVVARLRAAGVPRVLYIVRPPRAPLDVQIGRAHV